MIHTSVIIPKSGIGTRKVDRTRFQPRFPERITLSYIQFAEEETYTVTVTKLGKVIYYGDGSGKWCHFELGGRYDGIVELDRDSTVEVTMSEDGLAILMAEQWEVTECNTHIPLQRRFSTHFHKMEASKWTVRFENTLPFNARELRVLPPHQIMIDKIMTRGRQPADYSYNYINELTAPTPAAVFAQAGLNLGFSTEFEISGRCMEDSDGFDVQLIGTVYYDIKDVNEVTSKAEAK